MCNYKDYTEKDFDMSSSTNLYPEEETDAAIILSNAVTSGLTLSQICRSKLDVGEAGLDTFSTIRTIIDETSEMFATANYAKVKGIKSSMKLLKKFANGYYKGEKMTGEEAYRKWAEFVMLRIAYRKQVDVYQTPVQADEAGVLERLVYEDPDFPMLVSAAYGRAVASGYTNELNTLELKQSIDECVSMYKETFLMNFTITDWALNYYKAKCGNEAVRSHVNDTMKIIIMVDNELHRRGLDVTFDNLTEVVSFILSNTNDPFNTYIEWLDIYLKMNAD